MNSRKDSSSKCSSDHVSHQSKKTNNIIKLEQRLFKDLKIRERQHLQEWIAKNPDILGEDLLIIQKEFEGFSDTSERLDLLALDKEGSIVVIENKLDDTGRNVVWQALKYASYCSTLKTGQIVEIYQNYLDKWHTGLDAKENLMDFLERDEEELLLNKKDQRIIFVANNYRKEVTSTVLWLREHGVSVQCFRAIPYSMGEEVFLQVEQIIPLPETEEFMISIREKVKEEKVKSEVVRKGEALLIDFWSQLKEHLAARGYDYLSNVSAKPITYMGFGKGNGLFNFAMGRKYYRVALYFGDDPDKKYIDGIAEHKDKIEEEFSEEITWERLEGKRSSRIRHDFGEDIPLDDKDRWPELIDLYIDKMVRFYRALIPVWESVQKKFKMRFESDTQGFEQIFDDLNARFRAKVYEYDQPLSYSILGSPLKECKTLLVGSNWGGQESIESQPHMPKKSDLSEDLSVPTYSGYLRFFEKVFNQDSKKAKSFLSNVVYTNGNFYKNT